MTPSPVRISIVVACRNERNRIVEFIDSLRQQDLLDVEWEAIIAEGLSDDGTREILDKYAREDARLRVITNPGRIVSTGLNAAIRAACGEIILRMDVHTQYATNYCRRCLQILEETGADNVGGPARTIAGTAWAGAIAIAYRSWFSTGGGRFHQEEYEGWVDTVPYGCWRRSTLQRIGLFDEALVRNQDDELNLRLRRAGGRIWQSPAIVSWYVPRSKPGDLFRQYFQYGFWKVAVIRKHRIPGSWRHLVPAGFLAANVLLPIGYLTGWTLPGVLWSALVACYAAASLLVSMTSANKNGWSILPYMPVVFAAYHLSYGAGFLAGLVLLPASRGSLARHSEAFTQISR